MLIKTFSNTFRALTASAALLASACAAQAATIAQTLTFNQFENGVFDLTFDTFDTSVGALNAVSFALDSEVGHEIGASAFEFRIAGTVLTSFALGVSGTVQYDFLALDPNSVGIADSFFSTAGPSTFLLTGEVSGTGLFPVWNGDFGQAGVTLTYTYDDPGMTPGQVPLPAGLSLGLAGLGLLGGTRLRRRPAQSARSS